LAWVNPEHVMSMKRLARYIEASMNNEVRDAEEREKKLKEELEIVQKENKGLKAQQAATQLENEVRELKLKLALTEHMLADERTNRQKFIVISDSNSHKT
jgi:hypothetical protein